MRNTIFFCATCALAAACGGSDSNATTPTTTASPDGGGTLANDAGKTQPAVDGGISSSAGWLSTSGNKIITSSGTQWMGRGVNVDDIFFCGYDNTLWMKAPEQTLTTLISGLISTWKPNFLRISLSMASYPTVTSWMTNDAQYKTPMTSVINAIGANPGVYVLVTLRSDSTMGMQDMTDGDPEATGIPTQATDATYAALVDTFANASFVMFGITNEPGGNKQTSAMISAAMSHAVGVIRAEEDKLGVHHHIVSVQGNDWTSDISEYAKTPLAFDDVVYEVHGYPPMTSSYTYSNIPVIIGEYGTLSDSNAFYADVEAKQISNLAWDFDPYSNCSPDLLNVDQSPTNLTPSAWGTTVKSYLLAHASP